MSRAKLTYSNFCFLVVDLDHTARVTERSDFSFAVYFSEIEMQANIFQDQVTLVQSYQNVLPMCTKCDILYITILNFITLFCLLYILMPIKQCN